MRSLILSTLVLAGLLAACGTPDPAPKSKPAPDASAANSGLGDWRATDTLFRVIGLAKGQRVADLFAGDGYYTFKLLEAGANVIAIDTDAGALATIEAKARELGYGPDRLITRVPPPGLPGITVGEVDRALCTAPYLTIQDRVAFFSAVKAGLAPKGQLIIVDFLQEQTPMGPPMDLRVTVEQIMDELEPCGFTDVGGYTKKIPYRFIVQAMEFDPGPAE